MRQREGRERGGGREKDKSSHVSFGSKMAVARATGLVGSGGNAKGPASSQ